ncbi:MAG: glycosyltransferase family 1 protein [Anaerolineae bacterium]
MRIQLLVRPYKQMIGLARYTECLCQALTRAGIAYSLARPTYPLPLRAAHKLFSLFGFDVQTFFTTYPLAAPLSKDGIKHLTAQQMAMLLWVNPRCHPCLVTVHDVVPFLVRHDKGQSTFRHPFDLFFDRMAMLGLKRADVLISDSHFTKKTVVETLGCPAEKVLVVPLGVEHDLFRPLPVPEDFRSRYDLDSHFRYILYVGSENPRKNLPRLIRAFAQVLEALPEARLIKIGSPEYLPQAEQLHRQVRQMGLADVVLFYDHVPDEDLALFYNLADLFVFPSLYEGFGLPPLEAMACGTPVVCSNAASLPEVVGDAAITVDPYDVEGLAEAMQRVLTDVELQEQLREKGLERAQQFTWERTARETVAVYREVCG